MTDVRTEECARCGERIYQPEPVEWPSLWTDLDGRWIQCLDGKRHIAPEQSNPARYNGVRVVYKDEDGESMVVEVWAEGHLEDPDGLVPYIALTQCVNEQDACLLAQHLLALIQEGNDEA